VAIVRASTAAGNQTAGGTSIALNKPASVVSGDVLIAWIAARNVTSPTTVPTGWTEQKATNTNIAVYIDWLVAGGSEPATYTWSGFVSTDIAGIIARYTGVDTTNVGDATFTTGTSSNSLTLLAPSITTVTDGAMMLSTIGAPLASGNPTTAVQTIVDAILYGATGAEYGAGELLTTTNGATGTKAWTLAAKTAGASISWALRPTAAAATPPIYPTLQSPPS
jgi:hypothetical protein